MTAAIIHTSDRLSEDRNPIGSCDAFEIHEWTGGGPGYLHVHHEDDEAWHIISGVLRFRFAENVTREAGPGTTVYVPAGVPHDYGEIEGPSRYLMILTPRIRELIDALHAAPYDTHGAVMRRYKSEIVE